jgi:arylformamidase
MSETIIDISPVISEKLAVFPGDVPFKREMTMNFDQGHHLGLSSIQGTVHLGAHTDAPNHYHKDGSGIEKRNLELYYGECQVIEVNIPRGQRILPKDIEAVEIKAPRILFKTGSFPDPNIWNEDFNSLSPELVEELSQKGVVLVGLDTPSVDPSTEKNLTSHLKIYELDMAILEGVILDHVEEGLYKLIALPLNIKDCDASPVRAVLIKES